MLGDQFSGLARFGERDRLDVTGDELRHQAGALKVRRPSHAFLLVDERGVPEGKDPLASGRAVGRYLGEWKSRKPRGEVSGIPDRSGGHNEYRLCAVMASYSIKPAQDAAHMRPKDTPKDMSLVHDYQLQLREEICPPCMLRQDAEMQHVGVGQDDVCILAHRRTL